MNEIAIIGRIRGGGYGDTLSSIIDALEGRLAGISNIHANNTVSVDPQWELYVMPMHYGGYDYPAARKGAKTAIYTMWETDWITRSQKDFLNRFDKVLTPSSWCAQVFAAAGITATVIPHYVSVSEKPNTYERLLVGGASAPTNRKRIGELVTLLEKIGDPYFAKSDDPYAYPEHKDFINFENDPLEIHKDWFKAGKLFISISRAEGWGLYQHKALASGVPLVTPLHGGLLDFVTADNSYIIPHTEVFADGLFGQGLGKWADVKIEEAEEVLRFAINDPGLKVKQVAAAASVAHFTKARMRRELLAALELTGQ